MKVYLTSVGERTTELCKKQLHRFGFELVLLDGQEPWYNKYSKFIKVALQAGDDWCMRIDADVVLNKNIQLIMPEKRDGLLVQCATYDFYKNDIGVSCPVFYSLQALQIINDYIDLPDFDKQRPETFASRIPSLNDKMITVDEFIVGIHGFGQDMETMQRAKEHKTQRGQLQKYDFDLAFELSELWKR